MKRFTTTRRAILPLLVALGAVLAHPVAVEARVRRTPRQVTLDGRLVMIAAIGGETTGWALQTTQGFIEVDLPPWAQRRATRYVDRQVRVRGTWTTAFGPERGRRRVLKVHAIWPLSARPPGGTRR